MSWIPVPSHALGPLLLHRNGDYSIGGFMCDQSTTLKATFIGDVRFDKKSGEGQMLRIEAPDKTHYLLYQEGIWYFAVDGEVSRGSTGGAGAMLAVLGVLGIIVIAIWRSVL